MSRFDDARRQILASFSTRTACRNTVNAVSFKAPSTLENQDRVVIDSFYLHEQMWVVLAVCDGHAGSATAESTAEHLPRLFTRALKKMLATRFDSRFDRATFVENAEHISSMIQTEITNADRQLGRAIQKMCERPETMTREEALKFIEHHRDEVELAFQGTTLAMAVVHVEHRLLWTAGLGNSTVAISTHTSDRTRPQAEKLSDTHTLRDSQEYYNIISSHPGETIADEEMRILGLSEVTRAIGDFHLKLPRDYLEYLFQHLPHTGPDGTPLKDYVPSIRSPPYISSRPSVRFIDLEPRWHHRPFLMLFTDGVDRLVDGATVFNPGVHSGADPADIVSSILFNRREAFAGKLEAVLGHKVDYRWHDVRANAILGNLLGGADVERLERVLAAQSMEPAGDGRGDREGLCIDDTSLILCDLKYLYSKCAYSAGDDKARPV